MLETLKEAYAKPRALTQNRNEFMLDQEELAQYRWELFPIGNTYFHEFNPFFVHTVSDKAARIFGEFKVFTIRDGYIGFTDFLLKNWKIFPHWKTTFLIPPSYTALLPENLRPYFLSYHTTQSFTPDIKKAKKIVIFGLLLDYYFGSYEEIERKLAPLKDIGPDVQIEVCLGLRRNPFVAAETENLHHFYVPEIIKKYVGNREIKWLKMNSLIEKSVMKDSYLLDLMHDQTMTCDSFLHFWSLMRGGPVNQLPTWDGTPSLFDLDLSFHQKLHVNHLPNVESEFGELLFFTKKNVGDIWNYSAFHALAGRIVNDSRNLLGRF